MKLPNILPDGTIGSKLTKRAKLIKKNFGLLIFFKYVITIFLSKFKRNINKSQNLSNLFQKLLEKIHYEDAWSSTLQEYHKTFFLNN